MKVLIADDDLPTRRLLEKTVEKWGYDVVLAEDGADATQILEGESPPQIAVLDWEMPGMDGIEICRRLQQKSMEHFIYIILLTGKSNKEDIGYALRSGAHDFMSKPIHSGELNGRLQVGKRLITAEARMRNLAEKMEEIAERRALQLIHADRLAELGKLFAGIAHEINNPVGFISGNAQTLKMMWPTVKECLEHCQSNGVGDIKKMSFILEETQPSIEGILSGVKRISTIVNGLKDYARKDSGQKKTVILNDVAKGAVELVRNRIKQLTDFKLNLKNPSPMVQGRRQQLEQVLVNFLTNALDATEEHGGSFLSINCYTDGGMAVISVEDSGGGVPQDLLNQIWDPFFTTKQEGKGTGLGLAISQRIIQEHGGKIRVRNRPEGGAEFLFELPMMEGE